MTQKKITAIQKGMCEYLKRHSVTPELLIKTMGISASRAKSILNPYALPDMSDVVFLCYTFHIDMEKLAEGKEVAA